MAIILGIDPGYDRVGWCIGQTRNSGIPNVLSYGVIVTNKKESLFERYQQIDRELSKIVAAHTPTEAALESLFFTHNQTTALHVSEARGVIISVLFRHQVTFFEYTPLQLKQAVTGYGRAEKSAVERMVRVQLKLPETSIIDDTMDAIAMMMTHAASRAVNAAVK